MSESLYIAERKAREELEVRAKITAKLRSKEKDQKEAELRDIAAQARAQRAGVGDLGIVDGAASASGGGSGASGAAVAPAPPRTLAPGEGRRDNRPAWLIEQENAAAAAGGAGGASSTEEVGSRDDRRRDDRQDDRRDDRRRDSRDGDRDHRGSRDHQRSSVERRDDRHREPRGQEDDGGLAQRDALRQERKKQREREMRMENMKVRARAPTNSSLVRFFLCLPHALLFLPLVTSFIATPSFRFNWSSKP